MYIFQTYVTGKGELLYNSVWRPGDLNENVDEQAAFATFEANDDLLHPQGWRLYSLQPFSAPGQVFYDVIWRPGTHEEKTVYGAKYADYKGKYDAIYPQGWRLYILNSYVLPNGEVRYDAVWRLGTIDRPL